MKLLQFYDANFTTIWRLIYASVGLQHERKICCMETFLCRLTCLVKQRLLSGYRGNRQLVRSSVKGKLTEDDRLMVYSVV
jgi:hypothetical protein